MDTNLLSSVMDELVICTAKYFPVTGEGRVWDDEVACRVAISISYFCVVDADPISRRRLDVCTSTTHPQMTTQQRVEQHCTSITNS